MVWQKATDEKEPFLYVGVALLPCLKNGASKIERLLLVAVIPRVVTIVSLSQAVVGGIVYLYVFVILYDGLVTFITIGFGLFLPRRLDHIFSPNSNASEF